MRAGPGDGARPADRRRQHVHALVINELNGIWTFHGLGAPGVRLSKVDMVALAESILERAR